MIEQLSTAVKFLAFFVEEKVGKTGLTVTVDVRGHDGSEIVTAASATEIGDGLYSYTLAAESTGSEGAYVAIFKTATDTVDQQHIPSLWCIGVAGVEKLDATVSSRNATTPPTVGAIADAVWDEALSGHATAGSAGQALGAAGGAADPLLNTVPGSYPSGTAGHALGRIGSATIAPIQPVAASGDVEIVQGDDYSADDGRAIDWTEDSAGWPVLTDANITIEIDDEDFEGSVVTATGSSKKVRLELTDEQTAEMATGTFRFAVIATLSGGNVVTLLSGNFSVRQPEDPA